MEKIRILLVDDHAAVREGLKALINTQPDMVVIGEAADGQSAWEQAIALNPDVVVMDLALPRLNGIEATERLKRQRPEIRVVGLSFHDGRTFVRRLFEAGASGYVIKRARADELIRAIQSVAGGGTYLDPEVAPTGAGIS